MLMPIFAVIITLGVMPAKAQSASSYWSQAGNADATTYSKLGTINAAPLKLLTNNKERMQLDTLGNVYIGMPSITNKSRLIVNSASGASPFRAMINNATKLLVGSNGGLTVGSSWGAPNNGLYVFGPVGVGTNTPANKLDIAGGNGDLGATEGDMRMGNASFRLKMGVFTSGQNAGDARIRSAGGTNRLILGADDALIIDSSGNIGMGILTPSARLEVKRSDGNYQLAKFTNAASSGDRSAFIDIQNGNTAPVAWRYGVGGTGNQQGLTAGQFYIERIGGGVRFMVSNTGNVGIGTTNPSYKLSVNGTIQAKEVRVETGWADHVFDENYKLRSLEEVAAYIAANKHLPDVPSAKEVQTNGLQLAAINTIIMQKVEELTLYVIQQQAEIKRLNEKIAALQKQKKNR